MVSSLLRPWASTAMPPLLRRALLLGGALLGLWMLVQATALVPSTRASAQQSEADPEHTEASPTASPRSSLPLFTWGNAAAVLLLLAGGGYALYLHRRGTAPSAPSAFRPMGQLSMGPSQQLRLVACGGEVLLLAVTDDAVTLLKTYPQSAFDTVPDPAAAGDAARAPSSPQRAAPMPAGFSDVLNRVLRQDASA
jgi:flagellar protein FliO/FliZ